MTIVGGLILSMAMTYQFSRDPSGKTEDAMKAAAKATYIQSGADKEVDKLERKLEQKYIPKVVKDYGGWIAIAIKVGTEHQITYQWRF